MTDEISMTNMSNVFYKLYHKFRDLILYGIIGCCASGLDFAIYSILVRYFCVHYIYANSISILAGISTSFLLNRKYNFKVKDHTIRRFAIFLSVGLLGLLLSNVILYICISLIGINELLSKFLSIILVVFLQFILNKFITFKH